MIDSNFEREWGTKRKKKDKTRMSIWNQETHEKYKEKT